MKFLVGEQVWYREKTLCGVGTVVDTDHVMSLIEFDDRRNSTGWRLNHHLTLLSELDYQFDLNPIV